MNQARPEQRIYESAELLSRIREAYRRPETVLRATLALVAGQPAARAAETLTIVRSDLKQAGLPGDSSVGTIRAACHALARAFGPGTPVPLWQTAAEARVAQRSAEARGRHHPQSDWTSGEIKRLTKASLRLPRDASDAEVLARLRLYAAPEGHNTRHSDEPQDLLG